MDMSPRRSRKCSTTSLIKDHFLVDVSTALAVFDDLAKLRTVDLIVPVWTMGRLTGEQERNVCAAVESGVGLAGCHGGVCDAFREATEWQFMTGGQWVAHPGNDGTRYTVHITAEQSPITEGIRDYAVSTEQYYLHVDPAVRVLATCRFPVCPARTSPMAR